MERGVRAVLVFVSIAFLLHLLGCQALRPQSPNEPPVAAFEVSAEEVYPGEEIMFDASASFDPDGTIVAFLWDFGDGNQGSGEVVVHAYAEPATYTVTLTVTDDRGAKDTAEATLTVLPLPEGERPPVARFTFSPSSPQVNEEVLFDASLSTDDGEIVEYLWDFGDGQGAEGVRVRHRYARPGTYTVRLEVVDDAGLVGRTAARITVGSAPVANQPPQARFTFTPQAPIVNYPITFDARASTDPDGTIVEYRWEFGDGNTGRGEVVQHTYRTQGVYTVRLVVVDDRGAEGRAEAEVRVMDPSLPPPPPG